MKAAKKLGAAALAVATVLTGCIAAGPGWASASATGECTSPVFTTSANNGIYSPDHNLWWVYNDAYKKTAGPQTLKICSEQSWTAVSKQHNHGGGVETYPNSGYYVGGRDANGNPMSTKPISSYTSITSTYSEDFPATGASYDAAYDLYTNNWGTETMIWNEDTGAQTYWNTQGRPVTIAGVSYEFDQIGAELAFIRKDHNKSGSVDILAVLKWEVANGYARASDVPTQLLYGVEIVSTTGYQSFPLTGLTFRLS
jgi:hypothetical protein